MGSSRLPGKVLADVEGRPAIERLFSRLRRCKRLDDVVLATTTSPADDAIVAWAERAGVPVFRGSEPDVLQRVVQAHQKMASDIIVEITGDCPLIDPAITDEAIELFLAGGHDVVTNAVRPSYPMGTDVQVFRRSDLEWVERTIEDPAVREHVSLYFYEHPERYRVLYMEAPTALRDPALRLQLDHPEDLRFLRGVYARLLPRHGEVFGLPEILELLRTEPELREINAHCEEKAVR